MIISHDGGLILDKHPTKNGWLQLRPASNSRPPQDISPEWIDRVSEWVSRKP